MPLDARAEAGSRASLPRCSIRHLKTEKSFFIIRNKCWEKSLEFFSAWGRNIKNSLFWFAVNLDKKLFNL
ncbi:hypothetical protein S1OALGB6SA_997 [Olavius algarvensis spirochete endosymbiont]|nr:hypothetical protein S1OALGB6SA_997 [Olavius algarvensis spirochete endosymbiont]